MRTGRNRGSESPVLAVMCISAAFSCLRTKVTTWMMLHRASPRLGGGLSLYMTLRADLPLQLEHTPGWQRPELPCGVTAVPRASPAAEGQTPFLLRQGRGCPGTRAEQDWPPCIARGSQASAARGGDGFTGRTGPAGNPTRRCCWVRSPGGTDDPPLCFVSAEDQGLWREKQEVESEFQITPVKVVVKAI